MYWWSYDMAGTQVCRKVHHSADALLHVSCYITVHSLPLFSDVPFARELSSALTNYGPFYCKYCILGQNVHRKTEHIQWPLAVTDRLPKEYQKTRIIVSVGVERQRWKKVHPANFPPLCYFFLFFHSSFFHAIFAIFCTKFGIFAHFCTIFSIFCTYFVS